MHPFVIFALILIVIWTLSGIATWVNKMQEAERRRRVREQIEASGKGHLQPMTRQQPMQMPRQPAPPAHSAPRPVQISEGIAARYPQVLQPPMPAPPIQRQPRMPAPPKIRQPARAPRQPAKPKRQAPAAAIPVLEADELARPPIAAAPPIPTARPASTGGRRADAVALARWLRPETLRQQFIVTEIFQTPIALRDPQSRL